MGEDTIGVAATEIPEECTTRLCHGDPEWAVRFEDGVSRRTEAPPEDPDPPADSVCPFVCENCRRERYHGVDDDDRWVRVAALVTDGGVETVEVGDEFVREHAVPREDAVTYVHVGLDTAYHPYGGYWFPSDIDPDPEMSGWVRRETELPRDEVIQYPRDNRDPRRPGGGTLPDWVKNRVVSEDGDRDG